jgi:hypothetical protein
VGPTPAQRRTVGSARGAGGRCDTGSAANRRIRTSGDRVVRHRLSGELLVGACWAGGTSVTGLGAAGRLLRAGVSLRDARTQKRDFAATSGAGGADVTVGEGCRRDQWPTFAPEGAAGEVVAEVAAGAAIAPYLPAGTARTDTSAHDSRYPSPSPVFWRPFAVPASRSRLLHHFSHTRPTGTGRIRLLRG